MAFRENDNGDGEEENDTPDITEMARRWRQNAPDGPSEDHRVSEYPTIPGDIVTYHGGGNLYIPQGLREKIDGIDMSIPAQFPARYNADTRELTIRLDPVEDNGSKNNTLSTDGGGLSETALAELIADLRGDAQ